MGTTAIYGNRQDDKAWTEQVYGWAEDGDETSPFLLPDGVLFAVGYERIVYGDHGPYIEFAARDIKMALVNHFPGKQKDGIYYIWMQPLGYPGVKVYYQLKDVHDLANAPRREDGKRSNYNRAEGYADYKPGMYYVAPSAFRTRYTVKHANVQPSASSSHSEATSEPVDNKDGASYTTKLTGGT